MTERTKILTQSEQTAIWSACLMRIEELESILAEDREDDFLKKHLREAFTESLSILKELSEEILCAVEVQIHLREEDNNPPWDP